nr:NADH:flavin oxidoreductase [uncultured Dyadobacter sp.]
MENLFSTFQLKSLSTRNRFVMSPMTRSFSPGGIPSPEVADYYERRSAAEVGLIISEGTAIRRPAAVNDPHVPHFYGDQALSGWKQVIDRVQGKGGQMAPQLWHAGIQDKHDTGWLPGAPFEGPSAAGHGVAMDDTAIADTIAAYAHAARAAKDLGFNAVEIQGAHGYLIDQFFWHYTNARSDTFGGGSLPERSRFAIEVIKATRKAVGDDFALLFRISQWRFAETKAKLANTPQELEAWLSPLADAGVDIFHCSSRRFFEPEFDGSDLNFAGWTKKLTGKATITVGSVGLDKDVSTLFSGQNANPAPLDELLRRFDNKEFDLVAVGRALLSDPHWVQKVRENRTSELEAVGMEALGKLI